MGKNVKWPIIFKNFFVCFKKLVKKVI